MDPITLPRLSGLNLFNLESPIGGIRSGFENPRIDGHIWPLLMWVKQCHKPPMTGNGKHTTYIYFYGKNWGWFIIIALPILSGWCWSFEPL